MRQREGYRINERSQILLLALACKATNLINSSLPKKANQSPSPGCSAASATFTARFSDRDSDNFYNPLQEDMDPDEDARASNSASKDGLPSNESISSKSSGIIHAVSQGDTNATQTVTDIQIDSMQQMQVST